MKNLKRMMALVLCIVMMLSLVPATFTTAEAASESDVDSRGLSIGYGMKLPWVVWKEDAETKLLIYAYLYAADTGYRVNTNRFDQSGTPVTCEHVQYF